MLGQLARSFIAASSFVAIGCSPNLGDAPFACPDNGLCPDGYSCRVSVCVRDGTKPASTHTTRATWINPAEVFWFASATDGGATLLVNDNFTQGRKGIYDIRVGPDGTILDPRMLFPQQDGPAVSSSIVLLPDGRYGIVTLRFPNIDGDQMSLDLFGVEREVTNGTTAAVEKLFSASTLYLGGVEPPYVGAVINAATMHIGWTVPSNGGQTQVLRVERQGSLWNQTFVTTGQLNELKAPIPPLSGDCQLFQADDGWLTLRAGFENFALATITPMSPMTTFVETSNEPLFVWKDHEFFLRRDKYDEASGTYDVSYVMQEKSGMGTPSVDTFRLPDTASPFVGVPFDGGVLVAPVSNDPALPTIDVAWRSPTEPLRIVASIKRDSSDPVYTARAFVRDNKAYIAWVQYHESNMDLWVGVADFIKSGAKPLVSKSVAPRRVFSIPRRIP
jgi:hypothetical protein